MQYKCDCSAERTEEMLLSLGRKELEKLRDEDPDCEVVCHFCHTKYHFDLNKLVERPPTKRKRPKRRNRKPEMESYYTPCKEFDACNELIERYWKTGQYEQCFRGHLQLAEKGYPLAECK